MKVLWGFVHGSGGMRRRVWFKIQKFRYSSGHPHARPKSEYAAPLPHAHPGTLHTTQSAQLVPPTSMALNLEVSNKAPALPIELTQDLMDAFEIISNVFGGSALGQTSMKAMQCLPLAWACLALKEAGKKAKDVRDIMIEAAAAAATTATSSDWLSMLSIPLSMSMFGVVCVVWGSLV